VQFHDDDVVPGLDVLSPAFLRQAGEVKAMLANQGLTPEFVSPRLWFDPRTIDGGYTSKSENSARWTSPSALDFRQSATSRLSNALSSVT
jgi:xylose isomerase